MGAAPALLLAAKVRPSGVEEITAVGEQAGGVVARPDDIYPDPPAPWAQVVSRTTASVAGARVRAEHIACVCPLLKEVRMSVRVVRVTPRDTCVTAIVEADSHREGRNLVERWHVILRPQADFNGRHVGYRVWLRHDGVLPETEAAALADACQTIAQLVAAGPRSASDEPSG